MKAQIQCRKETPIIFQADSIKAILKNKKFQTRRLIKPQPPGNCNMPVFDQKGRGWFYEGLDDDGDCLDSWPKNDTGLVSPYGGKGDSLWVRETWAAIGMAANLPVKKMNMVYGDNIVYKASESHTVYHDWKSSIFMPQWASRIEFILTGIRAERVSQISREDAFKEGVEVFNPNMHYYCDEGTDLDPTPVHRCDPIRTYRYIWNELHAKARRVKKNPYTGQKEDCYVAYPFDAEDREEGAEEYRGKMLYWIPAPWVWVLEWEKVTVKRKS